MIVKAMLLGNNYLVMIALVGITQSFHFCTLEEYYIGGLFMGPGNGVTDASFPIIALIILCGYPGPEMINQTATLAGFELRICEWIIVGVMISQIISCILKYDIFFH